MSRVVVDLERLSELIDRMAAYQEHLTRVGGEVEARARVLNETWAGAAAVEYTRAKARWAAGATEVHEALAVLRSIARTAHANYQAAALANRRMWAT